MPPRSKSRKSGKKSGGRFTAILFFGLLGPGLVVFVLWHASRPDAEVPRRFIPAPLPHTSAPVAVIPPKTNPPPALVVPEKTNSLPVAAAPMPPPEIKPAPPVEIRPIPNPAPTNIPPPPIITVPRPVETVLEAQVALVRQGISPGSIDGRSGSQTSAAILAFQQKLKLPQTGILDSETRNALTIMPPGTIAYTVTSDDLKRLHPLPKTWLDKSAQTNLDFENLLELLGEKSFSSPKFIQEINPGVDWNNVAAGDKVTIPDVQYPALPANPAFIRISLQRCVLEVFDGQTNLLLHFPCSIGHIASKRPSGQLKVMTVATDPNYTFDPSVFPESPEAQNVGHKLILPPGPNNPVGVAWIGLDRSGYGIHGTPAPEQVGRTESHGCFRLANWNAAFLARQVWVGMDVIVE